MGEITDRLFLRPHHLLAASKVDVDDAISLVAYAKLPLKHLLTGKNLVPGFVERHENGVIKSLMTESQRVKLLSKYEEHIAPMRYPVGPSQYEPLLELMLEAGESSLPFFFHDHHLLVDRRRRWALSYQLRVHLAKAASRKEITLQFSDSQRAFLISSGTWMTQETLSSYLSDQGVAPWWDDASNQKSHAKLERISFGAAVNLPDVNKLEPYDDQQIPSFLFAEMLLKGAFQLRGGYGRASLPASSVSVADLSDSEIKFAGSHKPAKASPNRRVLPQFDNTRELSPGGNEARNLPVKEDSYRQAEINKADLHRDPIADKENQSTAPGDEETMLTKRDVAALLNVSINTVDNYRERPGFPKPIKYGPTALRWNLGEIRRWLATKKSK